MAETTYNITLTANHQSLTAEYLPLAAESVQYLTAKVVCETEDWTGREIKAMFGRGCTVYEVTVTGGEITAKQQLNLTAGDWRVWLVGNSARDGDVIPRITTNIAHISVAPTGGTEGSPFPAVPPTVEEQLRADMGNLADLATEDKSSLVAAINEAAASGGSKDAVTYTPQTLTTEQQNQARANIGAGQPVFVVNVTGVGGSAGYTADKTAAEIEAAYQAGRTIVCRWVVPFIVSGMPVELPLKSRVKERVFIFAVDQLVKKQIFTITVEISDSGVKPSVVSANIYEKPASGIPKTDLADDVQTSLAQADAAVSLGLTAATPGQIIKVKTVQDGKPTEWEAVDMPSGGDEWELIAHINVADDIEKDVTVWEYNNLPRYKYSAYKKVSLEGSSEVTDSGCTILINNENSQASGMTYGKSGSPKSCIGMLYVMPFGWTHCKTVDTASPNNIALGGFNAMLTALPLSDNAITSIKLSAHSTYKIASGEIWLYGKKG